MIIHTRDEWAVREPVAKPAWRGARYVVVHWTAVPNAADQEERGTVSLLRGMEAHHMDAKHGFAIFYGFVVDQDGEVWEGRGWDFHGGAQGVYESDQQDVSISAILGPGETPSAAMLQALAEFTREAESRGWSAGRRGHKDFKNKACPGPDLYEWVYEEIEDMFTPEQEHTLKELVRAIDEMESSGYGYKYAIELVRRERNLPLHADNVEQMSLLSHSAAAAEAAADSAHERLDKLRDI